MIREYIERKIKSLSYESRKGEYYTDRLVWTLHSILGSMDGIYYLEEEYINGYGGHGYRYRVRERRTEDMPVDTPHMDCIHVLNNDIDFDAIDEYIKDFSEISGEICASLLGDDLYTSRKGLLAVYMLAQPTAIYEADCWSRTIKSGPAKGRRIAHECFTGNPDRHELWVIPKNSRIIGIVVDGFSAKTMTLITQKINNIGLPVFTWRP